MPRDEAAPLRVRVGVEEERGSDETAREQLVERPDTCWFGWRQRCRGRVGEGEGRGKGERGEGRGMKEGERRISGKGTPAKQWGCMICILYSGLKSPVI